MVAPNSTGCLSEDELLELATGGLADAPAADAHLASCATCSALLAAAVRAPRRGWDALAGQTLGPYQIEAQIGAGGMGAVYRARDPRLGRTIAIKVLHDQSAAQAERLAAEARAAAAIGHRAIVAVHDVGVADGIAYVAMELVDGQSLRSLLARGPLGIARTRELAVELVDGLAAAHARGIVHRDLKPENLVITRDGLRILDFGVASTTANPRVVEAAAGGYGWLTASGHGTAGYMAPEQVQGSRADARADLFATGAIVYELATGRRAFAGATLEERLSATLRDTPSLDGLGELAPIVERCLAKEPAERFQTATDLAWALEHTTTPTAARPRTSRRAFLVGGAAAVATGALGYLAGRGRVKPAAAAPPLRWLTHRTGRVYTARFTRDGNRIVYGAAWDTSPLQIHLLDLGSGNTSVLDMPAGDVLAVSPRGEIAASLGHRFVDHQSMRGHLALLSLAGGAPRPIADDVQEADFVFDGKIGSTGEASMLPSGSIAVVRASETGFRIELPLRTPLVEEKRWITHMRVSPDGKKLAYLLHPHTDDDQGGLVVLDIATKTTQVVTKGWISIAGIAWDPAGDSIWFTASREDLGNTLYRTSLTGDVTPLVTPTAPRVRLHDVSATGRALITLDAWRLRAMAGERDVSLSEVSAVCDFSPDGTQLVIGELGGVEASIGTYLVPYEGGKPLRLGPGFPVAMSPSGQRVATNVHTADKLVVYSTTSGEAPSMAAPGFVTFARWIDERSLVALYDHGLWRLSLDGQPVKLSDVGAPFALDPERKRCAFVDRSHALRVLDIASGTLRTVPGDFTRAFVCGWPTAQRLIAVCSTTTPLQVGLVDPDTGARTRHLEVQPPLVGLKAVDVFLLHADGQRHAYSYGQELSQLCLRG
ncbi:MAG: serine/threonine-protein kinase [Kofleriaceae bacterium]|nr:serine/threonine-protein kinase [Kofleriaceae bacterium]